MTDATTLPHPYSPYPQPENVPTIFRNLLISQICWFQIFCCNFCLRRIETEIYEVLLLNDKKRKIYMRGRGKQPKVTCTFNLAIFRGI